jgi:DNA repair exonuclease SbcCD ATPase subunit
MSDGFWNSDNKSSNNHEDDSKDDEFDIPFSDDESEDDGEDEGVAVESMDTGEVERRIERAKKLLNAVKSKYEQGAGRYEDGTQKLYDAHASLKSSANRVEKLEDAVQNFCDAHKHINRPCDYQQLEGQLEEVEAELRQAVSNMLAIVQESNVEPRYELKMEKSLDKLNKNYEEMDEWTTNF